MHAVIQLHLAFCSLQIYWSSPVATGFAQERPPWLGVGPASERWWGWPSWETASLPSPWWKLGCLRAPVRAGTSLLPPLAQSRTASLNLASYTRAGTAYCGGDGKGWGGEERNSAWIHLKEKQTWKQVDKWEVRGSESEDSNGLRSKTQ